MCLWQGIAAEAFSIAVFTRIIVLHTAILVAAMACNGINTNNKHAKYREKYFILL
jgi:acid phosphatase family membrane protein YuiD